MKYTFLKDDPMAIEVLMEFLPMDPPWPQLPVPDIDTEQVCWGLKYVGPDGKNGFITPATANTLTSAKITVHDLRVGDAYRRRLDLQSLARFDKPGTYRVALVFDNSKLVRQNPKEWTGYVSGQPFEIIVSSR